VALMLDVAQELRALGLLSEGAGDTLTPGAPA
jgi:hypothetical protein